MSGAKPKQQQSRSSKDGWKDPDAGTLETISKAEAVEIAKEVKVEEVANSSFFDYFDKGEEDGEHS
jgi:hypothetical protein